MVNRSKQKGTAFETAIVNYLRSLWFPTAERRALSGGKDKGDIVNVTIGNEYPLVVECKNHSRLDLSGWVDEAIAERINAGADGAVVIHKRRGKSNPADQYVTTTTEQFFTMLKLAHFAGQLSA